MDIFVPLGLVRMTPDIQEKDRERFCLALDESQRAFFVLWPGLPPSLPMRATDRLAVLQYLSQDDCLTYGVTVPSYDDWSTPAAQVDSRERWRIWKEQGRPATFPPSPMREEARRLAERHKGWLETEWAFSREGAIPTLIVRGGPEEDYDLYPDYDASPWGRDYPTMVRDYTDYYARFREVEAFIQFAGGSDPYRYRFLAEEAARAGG